MVRGLLAFALLLNSSLALAAPFALPTREIVYDTVRKMWLSPDELSMFIIPGDTIVMGEQHATNANKNDAGIQIHHGNQTLLLNFLKQRGLAPSVGMEFFEYTNQHFVDQLLAKKMSEAEFLKAIGWGNMPFEFYRDQVMHAKPPQSTTLALNIPRSITQQVSKYGPDILSPADRALLPPIWERGSEIYFERFADAMGGHVSPDKLDNYFLAQSLWDDTMAWNVAKFRKTSQRVLMVIVGEFHALFGHGLPARLARHGVSQVKTVIQVEVPDFEEKTVEAAVADNPKYGRQADFIWVYLR